MKETHKVVDEGRLRDFFHCTNNHIYVACEWMYSLWFERLIISLFRYFTVRIAKLECLILVLKTVFREGLLTDEKRVEIQLFWNNRPI